MFGGCTCVPGGVAEGFDEILPTGKERLQVSMGNTRQETDDSLRRTKVVATLGPASFNEETIFKIIKAGTDIICLPLEYRSSSGLIETIYPMIRKCAKEAGRKVEVMGELAGPRFRVGDLVGGYVGGPGESGPSVPVVEGEILEFGICKDDGDNTRPGRITLKSTVETNALLKACKPGIDLLIEDGLLKFNVVEKMSEKELKVKVVKGGEVKARKFINVPDAEIDCSALTAKDAEDVAFMMMLDPPCEYICVSSVQKAQDLQDLIDTMDRERLPPEIRPKICSKIEKLQALKNIDGILAKSQALMVARGGLGVELELERVPFVQKLLIKKAKEAGLFVITSDMMIESMVDADQPNPAEVADLQNAVWDGTDAVMLRSETAAGKMPVESVMAGAAAVLQAESVQGLIMPRLPDDFSVDEGNKPREMNDSKRKTKVVASLGPATWSEPMIQEMIKAGTDIFHLHCRHFRGGDIERTYPLIRTYAKELGRKVEVLFEFRGNEGAPGALTEKDFSDAEILLCTLDPPCEYICVPFVQKAQDLQDLIDFMDRWELPPERRPKICAKIDKPQALTNIDGIVEKSQALMVERGCLHVELGVNRVPFAQKLLVQKAKQCGLFCITAGGLVVSMMKQPLPTRAESTDLCNAVWDGTDAVMLEQNVTGSGKYPVEAVRAGASAVLEAESVAHRILPGTPSVV